MPASPLTRRLSKTILDLIVSGEFKKGDHLSTPKLAERFDVSRSPVREALESLAARGILVNEHNRGFFVSGKKPSRADKETANVVTDEPPGYYELTEDWLKDAIPSEITEQFLRKKYGLSSVQLGKVLSLGIAEGWIERRGGYGWRLLPVAKTPDSLEHIYRMRLTIEPAALLEPTFKLDREALEANRKTQQRMLSSGIQTLSPAGLITIGAQFHEDLMRMSGNLFFLQTLGRLNRIRRLLEYRSMVDRDRLYLQCKEHLEILDMLEAGTNVEASHFVRRHLNNAMIVKSSIHRSKHVLIEI